MALPPVTSAKITFVSFTLLADIPFVAARTSSRVAMLVVAIALSVISPSVSIKARTDVEGRADE